MNPYEVLPDGTVRIDLGRGVYTLIDAEDHELIRDRRWYVHGAGYVATGSSGRGTWERLHRTILQAQPGQVVDHINRDKLDNRRDNLRFVTASGNARNRGIRGQNATGYKGVQKRTHPSGRVRFHARYGSPPNRVSVGWFDTAEEAARAYDRSITEAYGEHAVTNESLGLVTGS